jgi:periplasmic protein CpxP/Spy
MKLNTLVSIIVSLFLFTASNAILAQGGGDKGKAKVAECPHFWKSAGELWEYDQKLDELHLDLKLTADQEPLWKDWMSKMQESRAAWKKNRPDPDVWKNLSIIERQDKQLASMREHVALKESTLASLKALYAQLTEAQRKIFNEQFPQGHNAGKP